MAADMGTGKVKGKGGKVKGERWKVRFLEVEEGRVEAGIHYVVELRAEGVIEPDEDSSRVGGLQLLELQQHLVIGGACLGERKLVADAGVIGMEAQVEAADDADAHPGLKIHAILAPAIGVPRAVEPRLHRTPRLHRFDRRGERLADPGPA